MATIADSSLAALQQFMVERLAALDPTIDLSPGSRAYSEVISPLLTRLGTDPLSVDTCAFIAQRLRDEYPDMDADSAGSFAQDVFSTPLTLMLEPLRREVQFLRTQNSMKNYASMTVDELDALLANISASRATGSYAYVTVRVFFSAARAVGIDGGITFATIAGDKFIADAPQQFQASEMVRSGTLWYIDVDVHSQVPIAAGTVGQGDINTVIGIDGVVRCTNLNAASGGGLTEDNTTVYARSGQELTERSLNSDRAIAKFITENISDIVSVTTVGFGEAEMQRDLITVTGLSTGDMLTLGGIPGGVPFPGATSPAQATISNGEVHIGGMTDVYLKTSAPVQVSVSALQLGPIDETNSTDVPLVGVDGRIDFAHSNRFMSDTLSAFMEANGGTDGSTITAGGTLEFSVEIVEPPPGLTPTASLVLGWDFATLSVVIDGDWALTGGTVLTGLRFRLVSNMIVDLTAPTVLLQQGTDLTSTAGSQVVTIPSGVLFTADPINVPVYVGVDHDGVTSEARVIARTVNTLTLQTVAPVTSSGGHYKIYAKQATPILMPLVQIRKISLASDGTEVPYRHPLAASVRLMGPQSHGVIDGYRLGSGVLAVVSSATRFTLDTGHFSSGGSYLVNVGDVAVFPQMPDGNRYYTVVGVTDAYITLQEGVSGTHALTEYKIGPPIAGVATILFKAPTLFAFMDGKVAELTDLGGTKRSLCTARNITLAKNKVLPNAQPVFSIVDSWPTVVNCAGHPLQLGAGDVGGTLRILTHGLVSETITAGATVNMQGLVLPILVDSTVRAVQFLSTADNALTYAQVAARINQQLGTYLYAEMYTAGGFDRLRILSSAHLQLESGAALTALGLATYPFQSDNKNLTGLLGDKNIATVQDSFFTLTSPLTGFSGLFPLCIEFVVNGAIVLPASMILQPSGLYAATVPLVSYDPYEAGVFPDTAVLDVSNYVSFGYELVQKSPNYGYSTGETVGIKVTHLLAPPDSSNFSDLFSCVASQVTVEYDYAPEVATAQDFLLRDTTRVLNNNPLARHFLPAYPMFNISYMGDATEAAVSTAVTAYLTSLYPNRTLEVFDILAVLARLNVVNVVSPLTLSFLISDAQRKLHVVSSQDQLTLGKGYHIMGELDYVSIKKGT